MQILHIQQGGVMRDVKSGVMRDVKINPFSRSETPRTSE